MALTTTSPTVQETLSLLEEQFATVTEGLANGRYALWLGSGVSRDRVPNVRDLVRKTLEYLHTRMLGAADQAPYRDALEKALSLGLRRREAALINISEPVGSWPGLDDLLEGLVGRYSELLGIHVRGEDTDFLVWEAVDVRNTYGPGQAPDCEHLCLAMLACEGAMTDVVSANWDGLIEEAFIALGADPSELVRVIVLSEELRVATRALTLFKFHGCAVLAGQDPERYRHALVATRKQITAWTSSYDTRVIREQLTLLATTRPTLFLGLSAQDENIQHIFGEAATTMTWPWPSEPPGHVVAGGSLGDDHLNILNVVYGEAKADEIAKDVLIPARSKAFLPALVLAVLKLKLSAYLQEAHMPGLPVADREQLTTGLDTLAKELADVAAGGALDFIERVATIQGRTLSLFRDPTTSVQNGPAAFQPLSELTPDRVKADPGLAVSGLPELAAAVALLGRGLVSESWTLEATHDSEVEVHHAAGKTRILFAANGGVAASLVSEGVVSSTADDAVIIHSTEIAPPAARSPRGRYGRTGRNAVREVDMRELLKTTTDLGTLSAEFRQAASL